MRHFASIVLFSGASLCMYGQQRFSLSCGTPPPPLAPILTMIGQKGPNDVDNACRADGGSNKTDKQLESLAKNNFCANNSVVPITTGTLMALQKAGADKDVETSRDALKSLVKVGTDKVGEGTKVQLVAYLLEAHYSNVKNGELVNCKLTGKDNNDIHIVLVANPNEDDVCNSFTAEMSPHFRPEPWTAIVNMSLGNRPVRVTGTLFFDGSHQPCTPSKRASPARASVWEIHPVYGFDICRFKSKAKCKVTDESVWIPLHEWSIDEGDEEDQ